MFLREIYEFQQTEHFSKRAMERYKGSIDKDLPKAKWLCTRGDVYMHLLTYDKKLFVIYSDHVTKELITIYDVSPSKLFRDFMRFYITKPQQLKHQNNKTKSWRGFYNRILSKLINKLKKNADGIYLEELSEPRHKKMCFKQFLQITYDYRKFYIKYLNNNFSYKNLEELIGRTSFNIDKSDVRKRSRIDYLSKLLSEELISEF